MRGVVGEANDAGRLILQGKDEGGGGDEADQGQGQDAQPVLQEQLIKILSNRVLLRTLMFCVLGSA